MTIRERHLGENELLWAVVAPAELAPERHVHLRNCVHCRQEILRLEEALKGVAAGARRHTPQQSREAILAAEEFPDAKWGVLWGRPAWAVGVFLLVAVIFWPGRSLLVKPTVPSLASLQSETTQDETLLAAVDDLIRDPLPADYLEKYPDMADGEGFLEFIAPVPGSMESEPLMKEDTTV